MTNDTWGLNFTSPIDAKQFRECCVSIAYLHAFVVNCRYIKIYLLITRPLASDILKMVTNIRSSPSFLLSNTEILN
jgi:hypothetical protein